MLWKTYLVDWLLVAALGNSRETPGFFWVRFGSALLKNLLSFLTSEDDASILETPRLSGLIVFRQKTQMAKAAMIRHAMINLVLIC